MTSGILHFWNWGQVFLLALSTGCILAPMIWFTAERVKLGRIGARNPFPTGILNWAATLTVLQLLAASLIKTAGGLQQAGTTFPGYVAMTILAGVSPFLLCRFFFTFGRKREHILLVMYESSERTPENLRRVFIAFQVAVAVAFFLELVVFINWLDGAMLARFHPYILFRILAELALASLLTVLAFKQFRTTMGRVMSIGLAALLLYLAGGLVFKWIHLIK
jgi:hypothetical protein